MTTTKEMILAFTVFMEDFQKEMEEKFDKKLEEALLRLTPVKKEFYSLEEATTITGIPIGGLKGRRRRGTLQAAYDGNYLLIPASEIDRLLKKLKKQVT